MKTSLIRVLLAILFAITGASTQAQQLKEPPSRVNVKFNAKYPQQAGKASWQKTDEGYTATFRERGRQTLSRFTQEGQWTGSDVQLLESDLRPTMRQYLNDNHKGYRYLQGYRYENPEGVRYQLNVQRPDGGRVRLDFNQEGAFVNEKPLVE